MCGTMVFTNCSAFCPTRCVPCAETIQARYNTIVAEAAAYKEVQDELGLNSDQLASYRWFHEMMDQQSGKVLVNMDGGAIVNVAGGG